MIASEIRSGSVIRYNGEFFRVEEYIHRTPGNLRGFVQAKLRNIRNGRVADVRFRSTEEVEDIRLETREFQYLYYDGSIYQFMDKETYDQVGVHDHLLGDGAKFLREGEVVKLMTVASDVLGCELPPNVELKVVETVPGVRGDTATASLKPAKLETGVTINVPLFVNEGDVIRVDTRSGQYLERVKN